MIALSSLFSVFIIAIRATVKQHPSHRSHLRIAAAEGDNHRPASSGKVEAGKTDVDLSKYAVQIGNRKDN